MNDMTSVSMLIAVVKTLIDYVTDLYFVVVFHKIVPFVLPHTITIDIS